MYIRFELTVQVQVQAALTAQVQLERARRGGRGGGHRTLSFSVSKSRGVRITLISQGSRLSQMSKDA